MGDLPGPAAPAWAAWAAPAMWFSGSRNEREKTDNAKYMYEKFVKVQKFY